MKGQMLIQGNPPNYFDPLNGRVPEGYANSGTGCSVPSCTVSISSTTPTFGYQDANSTIFADFSSGTQLTLSDTFIRNSLPIEYVFTDVAFTSISLLSATRGITFAFSGNTLTINTPGSLSPGSYSAVFGINQVPEPSIFGLLATATAMCAIRIRRRRSRTSE